MSRGRTPGRGAPREERRFDQTYLDHEAKGHLVHRDYLAHCFRWSFAWRFGSRRHVLDVGCGPTWPLGRVLQCHGSMGQRAASYLGVDLSPIEGGDRDVATYTVLGGFDFVSGWSCLRTRRPEGWDLVCSFEVVEHMALEDAREAIRGMASLCAPGGTVLLSTPLNDGTRKQARNHVHELSAAEMASAISDAGLTLARRFGTFGDVVALERAATPQHRVVMAELAEFHGPETLACFLAPLYPDASKNNLWLCRKES